MKKIRHKWDKANVCKVCGIKRHIETFKIGDVYQHKAYYFDSFGKPFSFRPNCIELQLKLL